VIENLEGEPMVLRVDSGAHNHWVSVALEGKTNRLALNARVKVTAGGVAQEQEVLSGGSYLSQNDLRLHFGLGSSNKVDKLEIVWPSGKTETLTNLPADQYYRVKEGEGIIARTGSAQLPHLYP
jgi:hypothetical protein